MRVVLDTNILVSALYRGGKPETILTLARHKEIQMVISPLLLHELKRVLQKKRFSLHLGAIRAFTTYISSFSTEVHPRITVSVMQDDADNRVLECAVSGRAQMIITGDQELLRLRHYRGILILSPADFLKRLEGS